MPADSPIPANSDAFDRYFKSSMASMAPDVEPALLREIMSQIDAWRRQQAEPPSRSEAIRRLIDLGLEAAGESKLPDTATDGEQTWPRRRVEK